jgi:hypothetical protein
MLCENVIHDSQGVLPRIPLASDYFEISAHENMEPLLAGMWTVWYGRNSQAPLNFAWIPMGCAYIFLGTETQRLF